MNRREYDAIVVGGGIAGLSAAATLVQAGRSVALLEKQSQLGGSSAMSGGWFALSGTDEQRRDGVDDNDEMFIEDMRLTGEQRTDDRLLRALAEHQHDSYNWMKSLGASVGVVKISSGQTRPRSHLVDIQALMTTLRRQIADDRSSMILTGAPASRLIVGASGDVIGVDAELSGGQERFLGHSGVILATGGFSRSHELLEAFAPQQNSGIPYGGAGNTGDGLRMAWRLGAGFRDMGYVLGTYGSHPLTGDDEHELLSAYYMGAIVVNEQGRRFTDESASYKTLGAKALEQSNGLGFEIFDSVVRARSQRGVPLSDIDHLEAKGRLFTAATIDELADAAGIDRHGLVDQVSRYNSDLQAGRSDEFGRTGLVSGVGALVPIAQAPFYAYPAKTLMTSTYAGLTVTPDAEVVRIDGTVIEGLYAAGEVVGGFHGAAYMTGTALTKGLVFGRVAARRIAARSTPETGAA